VTRTRDPLSPKRDIQLSDRPITIDA